MPNNKKQEPEDASGNRRRWKIPAIFSGKRGKAVGIGAIAAPIVGLIANDLRKANGFIRGAIAPAITRLLPRKISRGKKLDISDKAEVIDHDK